MVKDIETRKDVEFLVDTFYESVLQDEIIGHFFTKVIALDLASHMPVMHDFWEMQLFGTMKYKGNPMSKHFMLHEKSPLLDIHFERWLSLWQQTIAEHFEGPTATMAYEKAKQIGGLMQYKLKTSL